MTVALIGVGGHGRDILEIMRRHNVTPVLYDDGDPAFLSTEDCTIPAYLGMNNPQARMDVWKRLPVQAPPRPLIDVDARVGTNCWVERGAILAGGVRLVRDVNVGMHSHLNYNVSATRTEIGGFCTIAPSVTICGDVVIGDRVFIGAGATICNLVTIGDDVVIGAGAVITPNSHVPAGRRVIGVWGHG